ncbi:MAG: hypothetical protein PHU25_22020, partial [Deltaproteobacteria bacterium]|nr:hypothetical protein [Deltaproteobacteria bacterium]
NSFSCIEVWGYDFAGQKEFKITNLPGRSKVYSRIWGDKVYVQMETQAGSGQLEIYMFDLPDLK